MHSKVYTITNVHPFHLSYEIVRVHKVYSLCNGYYVLRCAVVVAVENILESYLLFDYVCIVQPLTV